VDEMSFYKSCVEDSNFWERENGDFFRIFALTNATLFNNASRKSCVFSGIDMPSKYQCASDSLGQSNRRKRHLTFHEMVLGYGWNSWTLALLT
jgi:hypothetical protein